MRYYKWNLAGTVPYSGGYTDMGEIVNAGERSFSFQLNKPDTLSFKLPLISPMAATLANGEEGYILLYRNNVLMMICEIITIEASASDSDHSVSVTALETMWSRLQTTLLGGTSAGLLGPTTATDQGTWLNTQLTTANASLGAITHTTITAGSVTASGNITGGVWRYKPMMELIQELSASVAGFDFWQTPLDPALNAGVTGNINYAPTKGSVKTNVLFEYGTGGNSAASYRYLVDSSQLINVAFVLPPSFPDSAGLKAAQSTDSTSYNNRGFRAAVIDSDLSDYTLRGQYATLSTNVRGHPRRQVIIQPQMDDGSGRIPSFGPDYVLGDSVKARVKDQGVTLIDATVRVYTATVTIDENGGENVTLGLVNEA